VLAIENMPNSFYSAAMFGSPGRDEEIENVIAAVANMGRAGIPVLGFHRMPASVWRTALAPTGRGGAVVSGFDLSAALRPDQGAQVYVARRDRRGGDEKDSWTRGALFDIDDERDDADMWAAFEYFVTAVAPAAEEAGVCLAVHPDDPPVPELAGVARSSAAWMRSNEPRTSGQDQVSASSSASAPSPRWAASRPSWTP
jgi:mannonate dehydratase